MFHGQLCWFIMEICLLSPHIEGSRMGTPRCLVCQTISQCIDQTWSDGKDEFSIDFLFNSDVFFDSDVFEYYGYHMLSQTTESGSNKRTMANEMHRQFKAHCVSDFDYTWDPEKIHVFCFCHKLALIVGAGLAARNLKTPPPRKIKTAVQGHFPDVSTILEEEEEPQDSRSGKGHVLEIPDVPTAPDEEVGSNVEHNLQELENNELALKEQLETTLADWTHNDEEDWDVADAEDSKNLVFIAKAEVSPTHRQGANKLNYILDKSS